MFRQQIAVVAAVSAVLLFVFVLDPPATASRSTPFIGWGMAVLTAVTIAAATVPWQAYDRRWQLVIPVLDLVAIDLLRIGQPESGFGVILAIPVIWMAGSTTQLGPWLGAFAPATVLLGQIALEQSQWLDPIRPAGLPATGSLILTSAFVTVVTATSSRHLRAQRRLLRRQSSLLEDALETARTGEEALRSITNAVSFGLVTYDAAGHTVQVNPAALDLLDRIGVPPSTPTDRVPMYAADGTTPLDPTQRPGARALRGEQVEQEVLWLGDRDRPRVAVSASTRLILRQDGSVDRVVMVLRDMTDDLAAARRRDDLVTGLSHEFRTPLSSVLGYLDLAAEEPGMPEQALDHVEVARRNAERLQTLVGELLVSRSREAEPARPAAPLDLAAVARDAVKSLVPVAAERDVSLWIEAPESAIVVGDAFRLRQVFDNLLSNAIKYNRHDGDVEVRVGVGTGTVTVTVRDTGEGIPEDEVGRLFEPFFRASDARASTTVGTGLGLTICREIVEQHHGTISVASTLGEGTAISFTIPAGVAR